VFIDATLEGKTSHILGRNCRSL